MPKPKIDMAERGFNRNVSFRILSYQKYRIPQVRSQSRIGVQFESPTDQKMKMIVESHHASPEVVEESAVIVKQRCIISLRVQRGIVRLSMERYTGRVEERVEFKHRTAYFSACQVIGRSIHDESEKSCRIMRAESQIGSSESQIKSPGQRDNGGEGSSSTSSSMRASIRSNPGLWRVTSRQ